MEREKRKKEKRRKEKKPHILDEAVTRKLRSFFFSLFNVCKCIRLKTW